MITTQNTRKFSFLSLSSAVVVGLACSTGSALAASTGHTDAGVNDVRDMFEQGDIHGQLSTLYYTNRNAFFVGGDHHSHAATIGGELEFTTAELNGFSLRLGAMAQRNFSRSGHFPNRDLKDDLAALGEAWLQWQGYGLRLRAGNQKLDVPFAGTYDWRILPQVYQGVSLRYGNDDQYVKVMRMYRYKSRISESYDRTTNYNTDFDAFGPAGHKKTDGFWAVGGADSLQTDAGKLNGQAWFFNFKDYANLYYVQGKLTANQNEIKPFVALQYMRETDQGRRLAGRVDSTVYGAQIGVKYHSITASLNYNHIPHKNGAYLNGALLTPYSHSVSSDPIFAQPFLTSTQDLGSGDAYLFAVTGSPIDNTFVGFNYSYMDLKPIAGGDSIGQKAFAVFASYNFTGALEGLSIAEAFSRQTQKHRDHAYWENRVTLQYSF